MNAADALPRHSGDDHTAARPRSPGACAAGGCPCRGTRSQGGDYLCSWHAKVTNPAQLQEVTAELNRQSALIEAIGELQTLHTYPGKGRPYVHRAQRLFEHDPHLQPTPREQADFELYLWRLREEVSFRCGLIPSQPTEQVPTARLQGWARGQGEAPAGTGGFTAPLETPQQRQQRVQRYAQAQGVAL